MKDKYYLGCPVRWTDSLPHVEGTVIDITVNSHRQTMWRVEWHNGAGGMNYTELEMKRRIAVGWVTKKEKELNPNKAFKRHRLFNSR